MEAQILTGVGWDSHWGSSMPGLIKAVPRDKKSNDCKVTWMCRDTEKLRFCLDIIKHGYQARRIQWYMDVPGHMDAWSDKCQDTWMHGLINARARGCKFS